MDAFAQSSGSSMMWASESIGSPPDPTAASADFNRTLFYGVSYNLIGNAFVLSKTRKWVKVHDPASQTFVTRVPESTPAEIQDAVTSAATAHPAWAAMSMSQRRKVMLDFVASLRQNSSKIKHTLCVEVGKTLADADAEFERGIDAIETACSTSNDLRGVHHVNQAAETHTVTESLGVCLTISPFNYPFLAPLWSIPYALLSGNTVVFKPSERTPSTSQIMAECSMQSGFPPGVFNIIHGGSGVVNGLLSQPAVRAVSFVGSDVVGEQVCDHARATRKRVQADCSGKNHGVVLEDASKVKSLYAIAGSAFGAAGQRCMAVSVVVFVGSTREWIDDLVNLTKSLVIGCGRDPLVDVGPVITALSRKRIESIITTAEHEGAIVALDGRGCHVPDYPNGNFIGPTVLRNVNPFMTCYQEEIFGPVLCCVEVETFEEAIELVNNNRYGNGCTLFTTNPNNARIFQHRVNVGQVGINVPVLAPPGPVPRTTNKDSFLGDLAGKDPWSFFTMTKTITTLWQ